VDPTQPDPTRADPTHGWIRPMSNSGFTYKKRTSSSTRQYRTINQVRWKTFTLLCDNFILNMWESTLIALPLPHIHFVANVMRIGRVLQLQLQLQYSSLMTSVLRTGTARHYKMRVINLC